jgi:hypothetical protein
MAYIPITDTQIDPDAPVTSQLMYQVRENPIEIAQGGAGAPIVVSGWHGHNQTVYGAGSALLWSHAVTGNVASIETPVLTPGYEYRLSLDGLRSSGTAGSETALDIRRQSSGVYLVGASIWPDNVISSGHVEFEQLTALTRAKIVIPRIGRSSGASWADAIITSYTSGLSGVSQSVAWRGDRIRLRAGNGAAVYVGGRVFLYRRKLEGEP